MGMKRTEFIMTNVKMAPEYAIKGRYCAFRKSSDIATFTYALMKHGDDVIGIKFMNGKLTLKGNFGPVYLPRQFTVALMLKAFPEWI